MAAKFILNYRYTPNAAAASFPVEADSITAAISKGISVHRVTSVLLIIALVGLLGFFLSPILGRMAVCAFVIMVIVKIIVLSTMRVSLEYTMDQNWRNFANLRMAPFTYMSKCERVWEVLSSQMGHGQSYQKYNAGCSVSVSRKDARIVHSLPFPFKPNVNSYALYLPDAKFVFLPDCVYMINGSHCTAIRYEHIKWSVSTTRFVESKAPSDSQVLETTWQYVNKKGGPDRRFSYNPQLAVCKYGEMDVNFGNQRRVRLMLSGTRMVEGMMRL